MTPTCPMCGGHEFQLMTLQRVTVKFNGDDHRVTQQPEGDISWEDKDLAICARCNHSAELKDMTTATKRIRVRVVEQITETKVIELDVPIGMGLTHDDENLQDYLEEAFVQGSYKEVEDQSSVSIDERDFDRAHEVPQEHA